MRVQKCYVMLNSFGVLIGFFPVTGQSVQALQSRLKCQNSMAPFYFIIECRNMG